LAGNIDDNIVALLEKHFGAFANSGTAQDIVIPQYSGQSIFHKKETEQNHICLALPGCSLNDTLLYPMILLNNVIGGGMSSHLFQEIREKRGLAYSVYSYHSAHLDSGLFTIYMGTAPKQSKEVLEVTMELLRNLADNGLTQTELKKGKEQLKGSFILSLESTSSRMNRLGKNELMTGKHYTMDEILDRIDAVNMEDLQTLTSRLFAQPFSLSMVGKSDQTITAFGREPLVLA
jgi:predicted Zn-dependent peptidase